MESYSESFCSESDRSEDESLTSNYSDELSGESFDEETLNENSSFEDDEEEDIDFGFWERYTENTNIENPIPVFRPNNNRVKGFFSHLEDPIEFFQLFIDNDYLDVICENTDAYYRIKNHDPRKKRDSHKRQWTKPNQEEIKAFLGLVLYMGLVKKSQLEDYWSTSFLFGTPGFRDILSHDHFTHLLRNICFYNVNTEPNTQDLLYKIRSLINKVINASQKLYTPGEYFTIDEGMVKFQGRHKLKIYMPLKPIKFGFKIYMLADSKSGYIYNWKLHDKNETSLVELITELVENYKNKGYIICMDRFYTTIDVISEMTKQGFGVIGCIMKNRFKANGTLLKALGKLQRGESLFLCSQDQKLMLSCWQDIKLVCILSNIGDDKTSSVMRKTVSVDKTYRQEEKECPDNVIIYSRNSRGVDKFDQVISYYINDHRSVKWYWRIVLHLLFVALYNSFIIYSDVKKKSPKLHTFISYQKSVIKSLVSGLRRRKKIEATPIKGKMKRSSTEFNFILPQDDECILEYTGLMDCIICKKKGLRKRTTYSCKFHKKSVCVLPCYDIHRKNTDL